MSKLISLSSTAAGRELLSYMNLSIATQIKGGTPIPQHLRIKCLFSRNMHPIHHKTRRRSRAQALLKAATLQATDMAFDNTTNYVDKPYFGSRPISTALNALMKQTKKVTSLPQR